MKFKDLPKEKRSQLILVVLGTVAVLSALGFGLIKFQYSSLKRLAGERVKTEKKLQEMRDAVKHADRLEADLTEARKTLSQMEKDIAYGDLYSWAIETIKKFKAPYKVDIHGYGQISLPTEVSVLPNFPYKQATLSVSGSAHYHDFGRFLADFENNFPHFRVLNLSLDLDNSGAEPEMLAFRMDIVTLVKTNPS